MVLSFCVTCVCVHLSTKSLALREITWTAVEKAAERKTTLTDRQIGLLGSQTRASSMKYAMNL